MSCLNGQHSGEKKCKQDNIVCDFCFFKHRGHNLVNITKFTQVLDQYKLRLKPQEYQLDIKQEIFRTQIISYSTSMRKDLECLTLNIQKIKLLLDTNINLMDEMSEMLLEVETIGEEQDIIISLLQNLETSQDIKLMNSQFSSMFLLLHPTRQQFSDSKMELAFSPSNTCIIRGQSVLDRQHDFSLVMKNLMIRQEEFFNNFLKSAGQLIYDNQILFSDIIKSSSLNSDIDSEQYIFAKEEERQDMLNIISSSHEDIMRRELVGIEKCDIPEPFHGSRKQMIKIVNYWIFYNSIVCEGTFPEPTTQELPYKKGKKVNPPIRCVFCNLSKQKEYLQNYFRYDPAKRCGLLCWFKDEYGREICAHEMCLIWTNRVQLNYQTYQVEFYSIIMAVQFAKTQKCRYCGNLGASLKCSKPECQVHFHFHCLKLVKLMSMQLDFDARYRFYCEDHVIRTNRFRSDWFITRIRLMQTIQIINNLLPPVMSREDFAKSKEYNYSEDDDISSHFPLLKQQKL